MEVGMETGPVARRGVVTPVRVDPLGVTGPTPDQARGPRWRRSSRGLFVPATVDSHVTDQRIAEAAAGLPAGAAVTGWAALAWIGLHWFGGLDARGNPRPVDVVLDGRRSMSPRPGVTISEQRIRREDLIRINGVPVTVPEFSTWYDATTATGLSASVTVIDMVVGQDVVTIDELARYADLHCKGRKGIARFRTALGLADENVWSPQETPMRLLWQQATGCRPMCNAPLFDLDGLHLVTPDLFDPAAGVAGEYDGLHHLADGRRRRDLKREEVYRERGIELVTMMSQDRRDGSDFLARLAAARGRARQRTGPRTWTIERPARWPDTSTVVARRALVGVEREIWLRRSARNPIIRRA